MSDEIAKPESPILAYATPTRAAWYDEVGAFSKPPGRLMNASVLCIALVLIWMQRYPGPEPIGDFIVPLFSLLGISAWWFIRAAVAAALAVANMGIAKPIRRTILRWAIVPLILIGSWITIRTHWPAWVAFELHRADMERVAQQVFSDPARRGLLDQRIGMYRFDRVSLISHDTVSFHANVDSWAYWFTCYQRSSNGPVDLHWTMGSHD